MSQQMPQRHGFRSSSEDRLVSFSEACQDLCCCKFWQDCRNVRIQVKQPFLGALKYSDGDHQFGRRGEIMNRIDLFRVRLRSTIGFTETKCA